MLPAMGGWYEDEKRNPNLTQLGASDPSVHGKFLVYDA